MKKKFIVRRFYIKDLSTLRKIDLDWKKTGRQYPM